MGGRRRSTSSTLHSRSQVLCASTHRLECSLLGQNPSCLTLVSATLAHQESWGSSQTKNVNKYTRIHPNNSLFELGVLCQLLYLSNLSKNCQGILYMIAVLQESHAEYIHSSSQRREKQIRKNQIGPCAPDIY